MNAVYVDARLRAGSHPARTEIRPRRAWRPGALLICGSVVWAVSAMAAGQDEAGRRTAEVWTRGGWLLMDKGDYRGAGQIFLAASRLGPAESELLVGLGMSASRSGRDDQAVVWLRQALARDPHAGQADRLLGQIYERRGEVRTSLGHFEAALSRDPGDVTAREGAVRLRRAAEFDATLDALFGRHVVVKFPPGADRSLAALTADRLDRISAELARVFLDHPSPSAPEPVTVILYPPDRFHPVTGSPRWAEGLFDGRMHLPIPSRSRPLAEFDRSLAHEYAHALVSRLSGGRAPAWLQEGLAQYGEEAVRPGQSRQRPIGSDDGPALLPSHAAGFQGTARRDAASAYAESYEVVRDLIQRHGMAKMRRFLTALAEEGDFDGTFQSAYGRPWQRAGMTGRHGSPAPGGGRRG